MFSFLRILLPVCFLLVGSPLVMHANDGFQKKIEQSAPAAKAEEPVKVTLVAEDKAIQPGRPFWVGIELKMAEGWDTYWINPGDSGFPTKIEWKLPNGFQAGPVQWPYPEKFTSQSLVGYGYTRSVLLLTQITPPKNFSSKDPVSLEADVSWLACKEQCVPGNAHITLQLPISKESPAPNTAVTSEFAKARALLPKSLTKEEGNVTLAAQSEELVLNFTPSGSFKEISTAEFIPEQGEIIDYAAPQNLHKADQGFTLNIKRAKPGDTPPTQLKGVLLLSEKGSSHKRAIQVDTALANSTSTTSPAAVPGEVSSIGIALGFAFLGGLILNVMPCVLPVIALKIFGFVKMAQQRRSQIIKHGGVFALGVLVSFWLLSGALLVLRAYGQGVGWGFQLQEPVFVAILAGVLFLLGLSLFGVFEMGTSLISLGQKTGSSSASPLKNSFMSGVLATLVATPCTGPLLGPALGFAMTLSPIMALLIFTAMGLGMASPYLLFSAFPKLVRYLPKPGNWMIVFKQLMGFLMMATVVWLVWVFGAQTDNMAIFVLLSSLLLLAIGAWVFGKWAAPSKRKTTRMIAMGISLLIFFMGGAGAVLTAKQSHVAVPTIEKVGEGQWISYTPEKVEALRKEGHPVFIDFTAKWCLICQANKVVLHSADVTKAFQEKGVITMTADWTKRDAIITEGLQKLGRTGVPVYVLYPADSSQPPYILPQTLTGSVVTDYLNKLDQATVDAR